MEPTIVEKCTPFTRSFGPELPTWFSLARIIDRVEALENLSRFWPTPDHPTRLTVTDDPEVGLMFREDHMEVGPNYFNQPGVIEKSLMGYWIGLKDSMTSQIATDFLWSILSSEKVKQHQQTVSAAWTQNLVSLRAYCGLGQNVLHHEEFCHVQRELGDGLIVGDGQSNELEAPVSWSIHSVVTDILKEVFLKLPLDRKSTFIERLVFLNHLEDDDNWSSLPSSKSIDEIDQKIWDHVQHITSTLGVEDAEVWNEMKPHLLARHPRKLKYFVLKNGLSWEIKNAIAKDPSIVAIEQGSNKYLYPSDVPLRISRANIFESFELESVTIVSCETPKPSQILEFDPHVRKVLYVRMCSGSEFNLADFMTSNPEHLVQQNTNIEFVEFNLAALRFAIKTKGTLQSSSKLIDWQKWLDWEGSSYDPSKSAYRPHAAIDGINWFRTN